MLNRSNICDQIGVYCQNKILELRVDVDRIEYNAVCAMPQGQIQSGVNNLQETVKTIACFHAICVAAHFQQAGVEPQPNNPLPASLSGIGDRSHLEF